MLSGLTAGGQCLAICWAEYIYMMANTFPTVIEALILPEDHVVYGCLRFRMSI